MQSQEACLGHEDDLPHSNMKPPTPRERAVAVALQDQKDGRAPKVIAAGRGSVAEQILALAFANGVKVREDADLAELLSVIDIDSEIPVAAFTAVAEILRYVYMANADPGAGETAPNYSWATGNNQQ